MLKNITRYQDNYFYYIWKSANIPTTFGKQKSFLELLLENQDPDIQNIFQRQQEFFSAEQEYGLLNRLDTPTSWLLTFAKTPLFAQLYKQLQSEYKIQKIYLAEVYGNFSEKFTAKKTISSPIAHSKTSNVRMLVLDPELPEKKLKILEKKAKQRRHDVETFVEFLYYDKQKNTSVLQVIIHKGIRHQIRAHLSSVGFPIIWDSIYGKQISENTKTKIWKMWEKLQLYCLGMRIGECFFWNQ